MQISIETLIRNQNLDGGFPYLPRKADSRLRSWTEPTVYAVLALLAAGEADAARRGLGWLRSAQNADGGWPPQTGVEGSGWVTALVALLPPTELGEELHTRAVDWLTATAGEEFGLEYRIRQWLWGNSRSADQRYRGWPWVPGAASWVGPTSLAILALDKAVRRRESTKIRGRIEDGRRFLLARMCGEGGWNHGSSHSEGYEMRPYPETTGMALTALRGVQSPKMDLALGVAKGFLRECRSADAWNWLRLGLLAQGQLPETNAALQVTYRTLPETSLALLMSAGEPVRRTFWG